MRLIVVSHKPCWHSDTSDTGVATDGGFPMQMRALASIVDELVVCVPVGPRPAPGAETPLSGPGLRCVPLPMPAGAGFRRKLLMPAWLARSAPALVREIRRADGVHVPIPGDVGTIGIAIAELVRKPLFVRHCGNWSNTKTVAQRAWKSYMERASSRPHRLMLATGGGAELPSPTHPDVRWIFSSALTEDELSAHGRVRARAVRDPVTLAITCRQVEAKGTGIALHALAALGEQGVEARLHVIGDGPDLDRFRAIARDLHLTDRVRFLGNVSHQEVMRTLAETDVFVFPTRSNEGFPKAVLEALACGVPVVASPVSVLPSLLDQGAGIIAEPTPTAVAEAVRRLVGDDVRYSSASAQAVRTASSYTLDRWADELDKLLVERWGDVWHPGASP